MPFRNIKLKNVSDEGDTLSPHYPTPIPVRLRQFYQSALDAHPQ